MRRALSVVAACGLLAMGACTQDFDELFSNPEAGAAGASASAGTAAGGAAGSAGMGGSGATSAGAGGAAGSPIDAGPDASVSPYVQAVMSDAPIAYWRLGEPPNSSQALDQAGAHHGTYLTKLASKPVVLGLEGAIAGDPDTAAGFNDQHWLRISNASALSFVGQVSFSIECWAKWGGLDQNDASTTAGRHVLVSKFDSALDIGYQLYFFSSSSTLLFTRFDGADAQTDQDKVSVTLVPDGAFHHIVGVYDAPKKRIFLYVNGALGVDAVADEVLKESGEPLQIGNTDHTFHWLNGVLDEVALYDKPLDLERIQAHHAAASAGR